MKPAVLLIIVLTVWSLAIPTVQANPVPDALRTELRLLAQDIAKIVVKKGGGSLAIGEFVGSVEVVGHSGPGIQLTLSEELRAAGLELDNQNHRFEISGRYQPFHDTAQNRTKSGGNPQEATNLNAIKLVALITDKETGEPLFERPTGRLIFGIDTVSAMEGLNRSNPPLRDPKRISDSIAQARREPQIDVQGTQIKGKTGQYALEVIVKQAGNYVARPVTLNQDKPFVELRTQDIYGVRLINNSSHEAAVDLRIDGVNSFAFSSTGSTYWIVAPHSHSDILGWHRDNSITTEFKVVNNFPDTAAARLNLKPSARIGLITASFSACWQKNADRPADEPDGDGRGTGFGDDIQFKTKHVERIIGQSRDNLSIRYEK